MPRWLTFIKSLMWFEDKERRAVDRMHVPACPRCHSREAVYVTSRTEIAVYFQCRRCVETIIFRKPRPRK